MTSIEENVLDLELRFNIAEQAASVEFAEDKAEFLEALMQELHSWDVFLERLQVKVATTAGDCRNHGEAAIRELRGCRNALSAYRGEMTSTSEMAWRQVRERVRATRNELQSRAAEVEAVLAKGEGCEGHRLIN